MTAPRYTLLFDGGCNPNPGAGYGSYRFTHEPTGRTKLETLDFEESPLTNNEAEWLTLVQALHRLTGLLAGRPCYLTITGDSRLVINQLTGQWSCDDRFAALRKAALALLAGIDGWEATWCPRAECLAAFGH